MARPIVYGPAGSTYVWSTRLALAEKGVAHELMDVPVGAHREEPHLSRHPFAKVPAFEHDGFPVKPIRRARKNRPNPVNLEAQEPFEAPLNGAVFSPTH